MKVLSLILIFILCLSLTGCNKDSAINAFLTEYDTVISDVIEKLDENDIDGANEVFATKKESLRKKWESIKYSYSFQISNGVKKKMETEPVENMTKLRESADKAIRKNRDKKPEIEKIVTDISNIIRR